MCSLAELSQEAGVFFYAVICIAGELLALMCAKRRRPDWRPEAKFGEVARAAKKIKEEDLQPPSAYLESLLQDLCGIAAYKSARRRTVGMPTVAMVLAKAADVSDQRDQYRKFLRAVGSPEDLPTPDEEFPQCTVCWEIKRKVAFPGREDSGGEFRLNSGCTRACRKAHKICWKCIRHVTAPRCPACREDSWNMGTVNVRAHVRVMDSFPGDEDGQACDTQCAHGVNPSWSEEVAHKHLSAMVSPRSDVVLHFARLCRHHNRRVIKRWVFLRRGVPSDWATFAAEARDDPSERAVLRNWQFSLELTHDAC